MNDIKNFYLNIKTDQNLPTFEWVMNADSDDLEHSHIWCQRAFPNFEPSEMVPGAPVLDQETLNYIKENHGEQVLMLAFRYLNHYNSLFAREFSHNNRRVTRLIKFLVMLEYKEAAKSVYSMCIKVHKEAFEANDSVIYWLEALNYTRNNNDNPQ